MWSWTTRLTDRIIALIDGGDFFRRPWRTGYAVIAVLLAIAGIVWAVALVSVGLYGLVRLYIEQHYVIAVQGVRAAILLAAAILFIALVLARLWWMRKEDIERDTQGHKVYMVGPVVAHLVRIMGESSGLLVGFFGLMAIPVLMPARDLLDAVPLLTVLSGLFSFDWTWPVITAPIGGFLIILFSHWLGDSMEVLFAIANNTKHVAIGAGQRPLEAAAAEPRLFTWEGALLGLLFYLVLALPLHGHLVTCPALGLLAYGLVRGLRTASLAWVGVSVILLLRGLMALIALVDERSVALVYLEREAVLLIFLFILVCAGLVLDEVVSDNLRKKLTAGATSHEIAKRTTKKLFENDKISRIFAIAQAPNPIGLEALNTIKKDIVVLEDLSISGNIGNITRTSLALGIGGIVLLNMDPIDLYDRRLIRSSSGLSLLPAHDHRPHCGLPKLLQEKQ